MKVNMLQGISRATLYIHLIKYFTSFIIFFSIQCNYLLNLNALQETCKTANFNKSRMIPSNVIIVRGTSDGMRKREHNSAIALSVGLNTWTCTQIQSSSREHAEIKLSVLREYARQIQSGNYIET